MIKKMPPYFLEQLLEFNRLGLIPGPMESSEIFAKRAEYCLHLKDNLSKEIKEQLSVDENDNPKILDPIIQQLTNFYDLSPTWIPLFFSNYRLPFWHGGCAWIFQMTENNPIGSLIQLRRSLKYSSHYLGIYNRNELLIHELVHVGRMAFQEPHYEELLAYQTAHSPFRRYFGPIVQSSSESMWFVLILFLLFVFEVFLITTKLSILHSFAWTLFLIPIGLIAYALLRLRKRQKCFKACLNNLKNCLQEESKARAVLYRLTDKEIEAFSKLSAKEIKEYCKSQSEKELRWQMIEMIYFNT